MKNKTMSRMMGTQNLLLVSLVVNGLAIFGDDVSPALGANPSEFDHTGLTNKSASESSIKELRKALDRIHRVTPNLTEAYDPRIPNDTQVPCPFALDICVVQLRCDKPICELPDLSDLSTGDYAVMTILFRTEASTYQAATVQKSQVIGPPSDSYTVWPTMVSVALPGFAQTYRFPMGYSLISILSPERVIFDPGTRTVSSQHTFESQVRYCSRYSPCHDITMKPSPINLSLPKLPGE